MNNIYEFGGVADVLLRFRTAQTVCGKTYEAGEPYALIKNIYVSFNYDEKTTTQSGKRPVLSARNARPDQISLSRVPLSQKIANLVLTSSADAKYTRTRMESISCYEEGELETNYAVADSIFVYDEDMNRIDDIEVKDTIVVGPFELNKKYSVFYKTEAIGDKYQFEVPYYPYMELEIFMKGNTNKISNDVYMNFNAVSLVSVPDFNIYEGGILNTPLVFNVVYAHQEEPFIVFE